MTSECELTLAQYSLRAANNGIIRTAHRTAFTQLRSFTRAAPRFQAVFHAQLDNPDAATILSSLKTSPRIPQTLTEKIVQQYAVGLPKDKFVKSGDYVTISPHHCMTHDNSWPVALKFMSIGASKLKEPKQIVMTLDHDVSCPVLQELYRQDQSDM